MKKHIYLENKLFLNYQFFAKRKAFINNALNSIKIMRYLTFSADYNTFLKDEFDSDFLFEELELPSWLIRDIFIWYEEYRKIIPMDHNGRLLKSEDIEILDKRGIDLVKKIKVILGDEFKVKYFSEGKLTYVYY